MAACGIAPEDDDGNAASKPKTTPAPLNKPLNLQLACSTILSAESREKALYFTEIALAKATTAEEKARINNAMSEYQEAA